MYVDPMSDTIDILLVDDNPGDIRLTREVMKESRFANNLMVASNGEEALAFLRKEAPYCEVRRPGLILLDLNLPKKNGHEVLEQIKADPDLRRIPVVVLTSSKAEEDILKTYNLHANCFISKPVDFGQFIKVVKSIEDFWLAIVKLPNGHKA